MLIIPVIDLMAGQVVHAKQGLRDQYQPIQSKILNSAEPEAVISSFLELYPFSVIYIADLDAIMANGSNLEIILELANNNPHCQFWLDAGIEILKESLPENNHDNIKLVLGSENKLSQNEFNKIIENNPDCILSLDFVDGELKENTYLLEDSTSSWPDNIITMMLSRVGSDKGVDMQCLNTVMELAKNKNVYAAGGIRNIDDIIQLQTNKVSGVLLASALHNGAIRKEELISIT